MTEKEKLSICEKCGLRKWHEKRDFHFDYIDCPYDCDRVKEKEALDENIPKRKNNR